MTTPSKQVQLTKIEQDALRYRVLRTLLQTLQATLQVQGLDGTLHGFNVPKVDDLCDSRISIEDVAQLLIDATQPSEYVDVDNAAAIDEICAQATREIAESIRRGIYQPLLPHDVKVLQACAARAERLEKAETLLPHVQSAALDAFRLHFALALLVSPNQSITIPLQLGAEFRESDYNVTRTDRPDACTFTIKRKEKHER